MNDSGRVMMALEDPLERRDRIYAQVM